MKLINKLYLYGLLIGTLGLMIFPLIMLIIGCILGSQLISKEKLFKGIVVIFTAVLCGFLGWMFTIANVNALIIFCLWLCILFVSIALIHIGWE